MSRSFAIPLALVLAATAAQATPRVLPQSYNTQTNAAGDAELEQAVDVTPVPYNDASGNPGTTMLAQLNTELEIGLTNSVELGVYLAFANLPGENSTGAPLFFDALRQRLRWRLTEPGQLPIDIAVYGEISEARNELELEAKIILEKRIGAMSILCNLWAERELYFSGQNEWVLNPTLGATYEVKPGLVLGLEGFLHAEYGAITDTSADFAKFNARPQVFAGPTISAQFKKVWLTGGVYARFTELGRAAVYGDKLGPVWVRLMAGIEL
ncbi:MAG: hypothetical protein JST92_24295 [Deltaproteobacteria bacterium]|nr:hypothetical protein [Deltaproteobacteria bacterium]